MSDPFFYRTFELNRSALDEEARSIEASLSSETPVQRWFGPEILLHGRENVDLSRLNSALINHDPNQIIGRWEDVKVTNKTIRGTLYFDADPEGERAMAKVKSGSLKGISVRYGITKFRELQDKEEWNGFKGPAFIATKWQPIEGSLTPIPADPTVGIGRDASRSLDGIDIERTQQTEEHNEMTKEEIQAMLDENNKRLIPEVVKTVKDHLDQQNKPQMRVTGEEFSELLSRASAISPDAEREMAKMVAEGKDARAIEKKLFDLATAKPDANDTGGHEGVPDKRENKDAKKFDEIDDDVLVRAITNPQPAIN